MGLVCGISGDKDEGIREGDPEEHEEPGCSFFFFCLFSHSHLSFFI